MAVIGTFTWIPSYSSAIELAPRVRTVKFGDGYESRAPDGINNFPLVYALAFARVRSSEAEDIATFLRVRGGVSAFLWTPPAPYDTLGPYTSALDEPAYKFICRQWRLSYEESNSETITATFIEDFNP